MKNVSQIKIKVLDAAESPDAHGRPAKIPPSGGKKEPIAKPANISIIAEIGKVEMYSFMATLSDSSISVGKGLNIVLKNSNKEKIITDIIRPAITARIFFMSWRI